MPRRREKAAFSAGIFLLGLTVLGTPTDPDLAKSYREGNAYRERISLNGVWQFQPSREVGEAPPPGPWLELKVPGSWSLNQRDGGVFYVRNPAGGIVSRRDGVAIQSAPVGWFRRLFNDRPAWRRARMFLEFDGVFPRARIWLNQQPAGRIDPFGDSRMEITSLLLPGQPNELLVLVDGTIDPPLAAVGYGVLSNVWIESLPATGFIQALAIETSVENRTAEVAVSVAGVRTSSQLATVEVEVLTGRFRRPQAQAAIPPPRRRARVRLPLGDIRFWSPEDPALYDVRVRLRVMGVVVDEKTIRTGFRQFEVTETGFSLNGKQMRLRFESGRQDTTYRNVFDEPYIRSSFAMLKDLGYNGVLLGGIWGRFSCRAPAVRIADEMGLLVAMELPELICTPEEIVSEGPQYTEMLARISRRIERYAHNPSLIMWRQRDFGQLSGDWLNPRLLGRGNTDHSDRVQFMRFAAARFRDAIRQLDPSRAVFVGQGSLGGIYSCVPYLHPAVPLQERSEWPALWAKRKLGPVVVERFGTAFPLAMVNGKDRQRYLRGEIKREEQEVVMVEQAARYFGDEAYGLLRDGYPEFAARENKLLYGRFDGQEVWEGDSVSLQSEAYIGLCSLYARDTLRAWRALGMNGLWLYGCADVTSNMNIVCHLGSRTRQRSYRDPTAPGAKMDVVQMPLFGARTAAYAALKANYSPLLAFLGGQPNVVARDHAYWAGEVIGKQVVFINDRLEPVSADGWCRLRDDRGDQLGKWRITLRAEPGEVVNLPVVFSAPATSERRECFFDLDLRVEPGGARLVDRFRVQVFPRLVKLNARSRWIVYDETGLTERMLRLIGLSFTRLEEVSSLGEGDVFVIGLRSLTRRLRRLLSARGFERALREKGLRVLVLEQTDAGVSGGLLEERNSRVLFVRDRMHPALAGLTDTDLRYWRGDSDLVGAWDPQRRSGRFYKGANTNTVATFLLPKPTIGASRTLIDGGFDQRKGALIELFEGKGRVLVCQLDLTERVGLDPAATFLARNLLSYLDRAEPLPGRVTAYLGERRWRDQELAGCGVELWGLRSSPKGADVLLVGPGADATEVLAFAREGGFVLSLDPSVSVDLLRRLGRGQAIQQVKAFRVGIGKGCAPYLRGLAKGDLFLKERHELSLYVAGGPPAGVVLVEHGEGKVLLSLVNRYSSHLPRVRQKLKRLTNLLLVNSGVRYRSGVQLSASPSPDVPEDEEEEERWIEGLLASARDRGEGWPAGCTLAEDPTAGHGDFRSVRLTFDSPDVDFHHAYVDLKVDPDTEYDIGASIRMEESAELNRVCLQVETLDANNVSTSRRLLPDRFPWLGGSREWKHYTARLTTGMKDRTIRLTPRRIEGGGKVKGTVWYDNLRIRPRYTFPPVVLYPMPAPVSDYDPNSWEPR